MASIFLIFIVVVFLIYTFAPCFVFLQNTEEKAQEFFYEEDRGYEKLLEK